jgi:hypothetical protein
MSSLSSSLPFFTEREFATANLVIQLRLSARTLGIPFGHRRAPGIIVPSVSLVATITPLT